MSKDIVIQTRGVSFDVKEQAEANAQLQGFSTLQDAIRVFIAQMAAGEIQARFTHVPKSANFMFAQYDRDYEEHLATGPHKGFTSGDELVADLNADYD